MAEEKLLGKKSLMDNSYTVPNVYSLHGGAAASDDTVGVSVQIDIKVFTVGQ